jgi:glycosyltransferase involved in cell wall biosynthesis
MSIMSKQGSGRIAFFHCNWLVQSPTANAIIALAEAGFDVELFLCNRPRPHVYVNFEGLKKRTNVQVFDLWVEQPEPPAAAAGSQPALRQRLRRFLKRVPGLARARSFLCDAYGMQRLRFSRGEQLLSPGLVDRASNFMAGKQYRCLIGVEKKGLIWAGLLAERLGVPFFYYSLELYTDDGDYWRIITGDRFTYNCLRLGERLHHRKAAATIIQDPDRARVLFDDTGVDLSKAAVYYVPVSVRGDAKTARTQWLQQSLAIPSNRKIILYFGQIWEGRYVIELAQVAQRFPEDWVLVLHGEAIGGVVEKIKEIDQGQKVYLSLQMVPSEQIPEVIASADIGLLFYSDRSHNERLTAFASEKMALYMQCGVPFLAFDYPGFRHLAEEKCGRVVRRIEELPETIAAILKNQDQFRQNAFRAFTKHYDFARNFEKVVKAIEEL